MFRLPRHRVPDRPDDSVSIRRWPRPPAAGPQPHARRARRRRPAIRNTPGYVTAKELPDGANAPVKAGRKLHPRPHAQPGAGDDRAGRRAAGNGPRLHHGIDRQQDLSRHRARAQHLCQAGPRDPTKLIVSSHPAPYTRQVAVYVPKQYVPGTAAPFIVGADGPDRALFTALDNLIAQRRVPVMIAISIGNGSGDAQGSERGLEYDTMSGLYAEFVEKEVLPLVEKQYNVKLTKDPEGRATMGGSSGGSCALIMAWYHPELYHRVLTYSGTYVNQQWPSNPETPHGAWEFHEHLIPNSPVQADTHLDGSGRQGQSQSRATTITTGFWPMRTWPKCWPPRAIIISLYLRVTPGTPTAR